MGILARLAGFVLPSLEKAVDNFVPDVNLAARLKAALGQAFLAADTAELADQTGVIIAEAESEHWLTATWRPITMLVFVAIVAFNYLLEPLLAMFHLPVTPLPLPPDLWDLLKLGLGGYVVGRSVEKAVANWKGA